MYHIQKAVCGTYQKNEVVNLTPVQIVSRLCQKLDLSLRMGREALVAGEVGPLGEQLGLALAIVGELQGALNHDEGGDIAANLDDLYSFLIKEISYANVAKDVTRLDNAINTVKPLVEAWVELAADSKKVETAGVGGQPVERAQSVAFQATF
ncbi:MAG: flagellar protein FliS [Desulfobulbaceae bacterium]|nr:flagellar protein FliS [Desulfobulbaceae bacterium]